MDIVESTLELTVQNPEADEFSSANLCWTKFGNLKHYDEVALIPYARIDEFIIGECLNVECPTRFHIERGRKRSKNSLKEFKSDEYLEYRMYWCSFGPENYGEGGGILPSRRYRLNTRNRAARPQSMRGCTCHFVVKRLYARPWLALLVYNERQHVNNSGFICHGPLDRDAIGPRAGKVPYIGHEIQQQTMSMIYLGIPEANIVEKHLEGLQRYCGPNTKGNSLASQYVHKLGMIIKRSSHELDLDDQASIKLWVERNKKSVFVYQDSSESDSFILGIQTDWQLQQMIRFGDRSLIAADSTFGIKRLKYPLCTLLVFDSRQHALPVAWIITRSFARPDVSKWMKALLTRAHTLDLGWKISGFLIDNAATEIDPISDVFGCPILFSLWRIRRSWLKNIVKRCSNVEIQREMFKRLGEILYSIWREVDTMIVLEEFTHDFAEQTLFMEYFRRSWVPKIEMWISSMRTLPIASQESSGAIEAYHVKLKAKLFDDSHLGALRRVDWLVHKLMTELHSSYWLDRYADESNSFQNIKDEYIASTSWHRALQIPDSAVSLDEKDRLFAKVLSQKDGNISRLVWNPGSEFSFCDCEWSKEGNLCKHVIKVNTMRENYRDFQASMSFNSHKEISMNLCKLPSDDSVSLDISTALIHQILDQIDKLVELHSSENISAVVDKMPLKWVSKKGRTFIGKPSSSLSLLANSEVTKKVPSRKNRKRKRMSRFS